METTLLYVSEFPSITDPHEAVRFTLRMFVPSEDQPVVERVAYPTEAGPAWIEWPIRSGIAVNLDEVVRH